MPTAERRKQPRPVSTEDDLARFHASVAGGNHFPTTTRRPRTRANTGSDLAHARETTREKRRTERPRGAQSAETKGVALARRICEVPPRLAYRADVKKPETSSGFWNWWPVAESNHGHADFQSAQNAISEHSYTFLKLDKLFIYQSISRQIIRLKHS